MTSNHTHFRSGSWPRVGASTFTVPGTGAHAPGKLFLGEPARLTSAEISMNVFPPGAAMPFTHKHKRNEEIYICISGFLQFVVDGDVIILAEGDVLRVATAAERSWRNIGETDCRFLCIQAVEGSIASRNITDGVLVQPSFDWSRISRAVATPTARNR